MTALPGDDRQGFFMTRHDFELVAVRHGRTAWNVDGRFQGHTDVALDERGREQARALGSALTHERFDSAVASDLSRARETAEWIVRGRELPIDLDARWREMRFGSWEGSTWSEIVARTPALAQASSTSPKSYTPTGGESFDDVCARVRAAVAALAARVPAGGRVVVVTHAGPLHALLRVVLGESEADALGVRFSPASISRFALSPSGGRLLELNRTLADGVSP